MNKHPEPCMCGDPECGRCFPRDLIDEIDDLSFGTQREDAIEERDDAPRDDIEAEEQMEGEHFPPCCEPQELQEIVAEMERSDE